MQSEIADVQRKNILTKINYLRLFSKRSDQAFRSVKHLVSVHALKVIKNTDSYLKFDWTKLDFFCIQLKIQRAELLFCFSLQTSHWFHNSTLWQKEKPYKPTFHFCPKHLNYPTVLAIPSGWFHRFPLSWHRTFRSSLECTRQKKSTFPIKTFLSRKVNLKPWNNKLQQVWPELLNYNVSLTTSKKKPNNKHLLKSVQTAWFKDSQKQKRLGAEHHKAVCWRFLMLKMNRNDSGGEEKLLRRSRLRFEL